MSKGNGPNKGRNLKKYSDGYDNIDFSKKPEKPLKLGYPLHVKNPPPIKKDATI